jgi:hypothetical protein
MRQRMRNIYKLSDNTLSEFAAAAKQLLSGMILETLLPNRGGHGLHAINSDTQYH